MRPDLLVIAVALVLTVEWGGGGCDRDKSAPAQPLTLLVSGDTDGWITPCGCTSNQSGGMPRRASYLAGITAGRQVVYVDAGGAAAGTSQYQKLKFEAILQGEKGMNVAAHNLGQSEAAFGRDYLRDVSRRLGIPFISANVRDESGSLAAEPLKLLTAASRRLAIVGVLSPTLATPALHVDDPRHAVLAAIDPIKGKYDALIVLAYLPAEQIEQLAAGLPEADAIVGGPTGQPIAPHRIGPTLVTSSTSKGKFIARIDRTTSSANSAWTGQIVELDGTFADSPRQLEVIKQYLSQLRALDLDAAQSGLTPPVPAGAPAEYRVAGNAACVPCHQVDSDVWQHTDHSHAWQTLRDKGFEADPFCRKCHTTGYGLPGGFDSFTRTPALVSIGCESCHGPSQAHVSDPKVHTSYAAADQCAGCHDHENSPKFNFAEYWNKVRHGKPRGE